VPKFKKGKTMEKHWLRYAGFLPDVKNYRLHFVGFNPLQKLTAYEF